ncbi:hypothetical protein RhiirC2_711625 [Rhizophagus irregularis]|uniref:Uncharacterized protein n=1 Tax=Rhizophagus irregularis TaxID=588596 RepID=A0A2N1NAC2_9GLOM|nr:hypothetical protein RhiirC2_711625 [Rhizophagus irregularis]
MALSKTQTESLIIPFRRMFKNKLKFARSAPNAILDNPYIYGYRDFYDNQLQAKITDFCIQLNDNGLLGKITEIRLKSLQDQLWTSRPLIEKLPYNRVPHTRKNNYILNMLLLCYENNISLENLDDNIFPTTKGGKIPLEDVVDNAYYSKHRKRLREKNILFLDQIISGDKSRLLLWKEILIKVYIPIFSQRKETKWYSDIRNLITSDGVHLNYNLTQLFGARVDNVEEARSYDIIKKNRSLIAFYNSQFNSVIIGKIQGIDATQRPVIKHFHIDMSRCTDTHTYIYQCMEYGCAVNASLSTRSPYQIISGDKSHLLLWKEMLIKAYVHISSQRKVAKWYTDIKHLITSDGIHLNHSITQLFGAHVDNVEEAQSYNIDKKDRSLIAFYNSQ